MRLNQCHNFQDFRLLAKKRLPSPIFNYIDGAADDEITYRRNTQSFNDIDLVPNVLAGVENIDLTTKIFGKKIDMPIFCAPTAVQRLFHHEGERAVARAAEKYGTMFGISSLSTVSVEEINNIIKNLYSTNFFEDIDVSMSDGTLFIKLSEHPVINEIIIVGEETNKYKDAIKKNIKCLVIILF